MGAYRLREFLYRKTGARLVDVQARQGVASFTFDDFPVSALEVGGDILERRGWRGTYYVAAGLMGRCENGWTVCDDADVRRCAERGHEVAHHTFGHLDCSDSSAATWIEDAERNFAALGDVATRNFAYPFGARDFRSQRLAGALFASCRGNNAGLNGAATDLNALAAVALYEERPLEPVLRLVEEARRQHAWIIFYTHDVAAVPSPYGCTPQRLERVAAAVAEAGLTVAPVGRCVEGLRLGRQCDASG
jgi:peptidoglycan/xylan/chitin deacetylase (PgdA/CDA1 family)